MLYILNTDTRLRDNCIQICEDLHNELHQQMHECYVIHRDCRPGFEYVYKLLVWRQVFVDTVRDALVELRDDIRFDDPSNPYSSNG